MKITHYERTGKPEKLILQTEPLLIWFDRSTLLEIEKGDTIKDVGEAVEVQWVMTRGEARQLAAFWFAIGERQHKKQLGAPWSKAELSVEPSRKYLAKAGGAGTRRR